jgi:glyoxylase-like metal-dependent hydrolase (beta-lactamase superfamily II)
LVLHIPDARAWLVGDLIEESGPPCYGTDSFPLDWPATVTRLLSLLGDVIEESGPPCYGDDSFPLDWPVTVTCLLSLLADVDVLVPGHGRPVDPPFARAQQAQLAGVADLIRELHADRVPAGQALEAGGHRWPLPIGGLAPAVGAGYAQLSR